MAINITQLNRKKEVLAVSQLIEHYLHLETNVHDRRSIREKHLSIDDLHLNSFGCTQLAQHFSGK